MSRRFYRRLLSAVLRKSVLKVGRWAPAHAIIDLAFRRNGRYDRLPEAAGDGPSADGCKRIFAVCGCSEPDEDVFPYMICALRKPESRTEGFRIAQIPKASWAVFRSDTCSHMRTEIPSLFSRAYSEWLPASVYYKAPGPDMELYHTTPDGKHFEEVWIPVRKT